MTYLRGLLSGIAVTLATLATVAGVWWLLQTPLPSTSKGSSLPAPATVTRLLREDQLNIVTLTAEAQQRLALRTGLVERRAVAQRRVYGGEVTIPPGQAIIVSAPLTGTLEAPRGGVPRPGSKVTRKQTIYQLHPLLTPEGRVQLASARVDTDGQVNNARAQVAAARIALDRARRLLRDEAGSRRQVEDAQAIFDVANKTLEAAVARQTLLKEVAGNVEKGSTALMPIECPSNGLLRNVQALPGQVVPAGAALFEVADLSRVWVRVPVYVGDLPDVDGKLTALAGNLAGWPWRFTRPAVSVTAPPSANALTGTVDLFYEIDDPTHTFSPGERIGVSLPLRANEVNLTVPWASVVHDIHGGAWVYEQTGERTYVRRRVIVHHVSGDTTVLDAGPLPGTRVVTAGTAELFGTEVGFGK